MIAKVTKIRSKCYKTVIIFDLLTNLETLLSQNPKITEVWNPALSASGFFSFMMPWQDRWLEDKANWYVTNLSLFCAYLKNFNVFYEVVLFIKTEPVTLHKISYQTAVKKDVRQYYGREECVEWAGFQQISTFHIINLDSSHLWSSVGWHSSNNCL